MRVVLLAKKDGGARPFSITSCLWRGGASVLARKIGNYVATWVDFQCCGGLKDTGTHVAHGFLLEAIDNPEKTFWSMDLRKALTACRQSTWRQL